MQRIKHHYCWVKAVAVPGDDEHFVEAPPSEAAAAFPAGSVHIDWQNDPGAISSRLSITQTAPSANMGSMPFSATGSFSALTSEAWPALGAGDVAAVAAQPASATGTFHALVGTPIQAISSDVLIQVAPLSATGTFRVMNNRPMPAIAVGDLPAGGEPPAAATAPFMEMTGEMFPTMAGGGGSGGGVGVAQAMLGGAMSPMMFAGATFMGAWQVENEPSGPTSVGLCFMPIVGSRQDALAWRDSEPGQAWAKDALAITLLSFAAIGEI